MGEYLLAALGRGNIKLPAKTSLFEIIFKAFWSFLLLESIWKEFHKRTELPETALSLDLSSSG